MTFRNRISLFVATFLIIGFFFLALPEKGYSGLGSDLGCCLNESIDPDICIGCVSGACAIADDDCPEDAGFDPGLACVTMAGNDDDCDSPQGLGCCVFSQGNCEGELSFADCDNEESIAWLQEGEASCSDVPQCAKVKVNVPIPTLTQWGLIAMAVILGIIAFMVIRRKRVNA